MAVCSEYQNGIQPGTLPHTLWQTLQKEGIAPSQIDQGYYQIDYARPRERGFYQGGGDCFIAEQEVLRYTLERWKKYRGEFFTALDQKLLPWDYFGFPGNEEGEEWQEHRRLHLDMAIEAARRDLHAQNIPTGTPLYRERLAQALTLWIQFPKGETWQKLEEDQRQEYRAHFSQLEQLGLKGLKQFLEKMGGRGSVFVPPQPRPVKPMSMNIGATFGGEGTLDFYFALDRAELDPFFVELTDLRDQGFVCGQTAISRLGVAIPVASDTRVFDFHPHTKGEEARHFAFYPLSLRQVFSAAHYAGLSATALMTQQDSSETSSPVSRPFSVNPNDGYFYWSHAMLEGMNTFVRKERETGKSQPAGEEAVFHTIFRQVFDDASTWHHPYAYLWGVASAPPELAEPYLERAVKHPAFPKQGWSDYLALMTFRAKGNVERLHAAALRLLELDPPCAAAHLFLASAGSRERIPLSDEAIHAHFSQGVAPLAAGSKNTTRAYFYWGRFRWKKGETDRAREYFIRAARADEGPPWQRSASAYYAAFLFAQAGKGEEAVGYLEVAASLLQTRIADMDEEALEDFADALHDYPIQNFVLNAAPEEGIVRALGHFTRVWAQILLFRQRPKEAEALLRAALARFPKTLHPFLYSDLHKVLLMQARDGKARTVWEQLEKEAQEL